MIVSLSLSLLRWDDADVSKSPHKIAKEFVKLEVKLLDPEVR